MTDSKSYDEILDFAIQSEQEAADFYTMLANEVKAASMKQTFLDYAKEERGHKAKLLDVKAGTQALFSKKKVADLKIADYIVDEVVISDIDYQGALLLAMKKEKAAFRLYSDLAQLASDDVTRELLLLLANEEAKHKLRFEIEYDEQILKDN